MYFWLDFRDGKNTNSHLLHLQNAAIQYMALKKLFEYVRETCAVYQHLQVSGRDLSFPVQSTKCYPVIIVSSSSLSSSSPSSSHHTLISDVVVHRKIF